ncbi:hypothetical protein K3163_04910 [Qipengyuania sp. 1NDW9]|uniref:Uncharacterized protein n=1 Tax=Qipengyuania aquimaris TaxID=255984 RepID=A0A9Q3S172_9SPHN|nr:MULTISPECIES: hypothetical protein [Qipengyuania]MBX7492544.1 hypothetical protein [Qipengyuania xiapuensis]MBY6128198.1 hypothetical protein [Qipengyuania aquimaris]MBY6218284.1 hypothetical protein [Qipengyuania aquimaris]
MLDFLDVFDAVPAGGKRRRGRFNALGRLFGFALLLMFLVLTIYALW